MRIVWSRAIACVLGLALYSCAAQKPLSSSECTREYGQARGVKDGKSSRQPDLSFLQGCNDESRATALAAYRDSFEISKAKRDKEEEESPEAKALKPPSILPARDPAGETWVCEVEASSKVFTGTGLSREEALGLARSTCVSHFQASYCTESSCKKDL